MKKSFLNNLSRRDLMQLAGASSLSLAANSVTAADEQATADVPEKTWSIDDLTPEQRAHAEQMLTLIEQREQFFLDTVKKFNGNRDVETRHWDDDKATSTVSVARGEVLEKAAFFTNLTKKANPPYLPEAIWDRYFELDFHSRTPLLGQLHATMYVTYLANGKSAVAGYMDYTPGTWIDEDVAYLKKIVDDHFNANGHDVEKYRRMLYQPYHRDKLRAACVGAAFYVRPMLEVNDVNVQFVQEAHEKFVNGYLDILERRKDEPYTETDLENQAGMRRRWLEDHLFSDPFTMYVVPYDVWSFADAPPTVHF
jgi:coproporphyrinogen III oxidase